MKAFMDKDFMLETETARKLFHEYAENTPILDYHCHINPREIAEDRQFENITQVWLGGDHYKWRLMRSCGVDEKYITGDASDYEKFCKWAECLGKAIGNPLYHWSHLELQRYFGYNGVLNKNTADEVWKLCNEKLAQPSMSVRNLIKQSNVTLICTTDDPVDTLEWHKRIAEDESFDVKVLPAWRPDKAMNIEKPDYLDYLDKLAAAAGMTEIGSFAALKKALRNRMDFFASMGCNVSDHALEYVMYCPANDDEIEEIYCEYDPNTKIGMQDSNRKVKGTLHWLSCAHCLPAEVRLYDRLWKVENPRDEMAAIREAKNCSPLEAMKEIINPDSLKVLTNCYVEKYLADAKPLNYLQFQRIGYFNVDKDSTAEKLVFNRTVSLKDTWSKVKDK